MSYPPKARQGQAFDFDTGRREGKGSHTLSPARVGRERGEEAAAV